MQKFSHTENRQSLTKCKQKKIKLTKTKILIKNEQVKYANGKGKQNKRIENIFTLQMQKKKIKYATKATKKRRSTEKASLALIHAHKQPRPGQQSREFIKCLQIGRGRRKPKNVRFDDGTNRLRAIYNNAYELAYTSLSWNWLILVNLQSADSRFGVRNASTLCRRAVNGGRV